MCLHVSSFFVNIVVFLSPLQNKKNRKFRSPLIHVGKTSMPQPNGPYHHQAPSPYAHNSEFCCAIVACMLVDSK